VRRSLGLALAGLVISASASGGAAAANHHSITVVTGLSFRGAPMDRLDPGRTGRSRSLLPRTELRTAWRESLDMAPAQSPLVDDQGRIYLVGTAGDVVCLDAGGAVVWRVATQSPEPGPPVLLSDRTLVFVDGWGQAVAIRDGRVQWRTPIGHAGFIHPSPVPLESGGVVVATSTELAVLDPSGGCDGRAVIAEPINGPLMSSLDRVFAVSDIGNVWAWRPGPSQPERIASFGTPMAAAAALVNDHTLLATTRDRTEMIALDLRSGASVARASSGDGYWIAGAPVVAEALVTLWVGGTGEFAVVFDRSGTELEREWVGTASASAVDTAPGAFVGPTLLVDAQGSVAFDGARGGVSVAAIPRAGMTEKAVPGGAGAAGGREVRTMSSILELCAGASGARGGGGPSARAYPVVGMAPLPPRSLVVACRSGSVVAVADASADSARAPSLTR
jgi:outer membrane protein assembly factor BamB